MLKANTRNMYFMFAGGGFGRRSPFEVVVGSIVETILLSRKHSLAGCLSIIGDSGRRRSQRQVALRGHPAEALTRALPGHDKRQSRPRWGLLPRRARGPPP